ncbi:hypothetical protein [Sphingobium sp. D43FB]|uniref:hypothetical protein n=1 Tax=Sphingobium sp. D43FB TaxID=2017595 RepID=UPI0015965D09|nr:hypothetical protein [Sphingobium sp. D43FB]
MAAFNGQASTTGERAIERTLLQPRDVAAFFQALDHPKPATHTMRAAIHRYHRTISTR